jgi:hypothetical protein
LQPAKSIYSARSAVRKPYLERGSVPGAARGWYRRKQLLDRIKMIHDKTRSLKTLTDFMLALSIVLVIAIFVAGSILANPSHQPMRIVNPNQYQWSTPLFADIWQFYDLFPAFVLLISLVFVGLEALHDLTHRIEKIS